MSDRTGLRRRRGPTPQQEAAEIRRQDAARPIATPGRPYRPTVDGSTAHGGTAWGSTAVQIGAGMVSPFLAFDPLALRNAASEVAGDVGRGFAELRHGETRNASLSFAQAAVNTVRGLTATPVGHAFNHLAAAATGAPAMPAGDGAWYGGASVNEQLQRRKTKLKTE